MSKLLKEYIQLLLQEKAINASAASREGLALLVTSRYRGTMCILYDPYAFLELLEEKPWLKDGIPSSADINFKKYEPIVGMIAFDNPDSHKGQAWGAKEILRSAAEKGYGPLMYDIAMAIAGGIMSDRESVSNSAKGVWSKYLNNRSDVEAKQLDDYENPSTETKEDDASVYSGDPMTADNPLNYAYFTKDGVDIDKLVQNSNTFLKENPWMPAEKIKGIAYNYFSEKYRTS